MWAACHAPGVSPPGGVLATLGALRTLRRVALGLAAILLAKQAARRGADLALPWLYRFFPLRLRALWQPPVADLCPAGKRRDPRLAALPHNARGEPWDVDVTARFMAYAALSWMVGEGWPRTLAALGW